jgi:hypothetical protein
MLDYTAKDSATINETANTLVSRYTYRLRVTGSDGAPQPGAEVRVSLEGDGSLQPGFSSKEIVRETGADGKAQVTWYRRGIFDRDVKATLRAVPVQVGVSVALELLKDASTGPQISWTPTRRKF